MNKKVPFDHSKAKIKAKKALENFDPVEAKEQMRQVLDILTENPVEISDEILLNEEKNKDLEANFTSIMHKLKETIDQLHNHIQYIKDKSNLLDFSVTSHNFYEKIQNLRKELHRIEKSIKPSQEISQ